MAIFGGADRYTNAVFAEDEDGLPEGWKQLSADFGYALGANTVVLNNVSSSVNLHGAGGWPPQSATTALQCLNVYAQNMAVPNSNYWSVYDEYDMFRDGSPGFAVMASNMAKGLAEYFGSKEDIKVYLWQNARLPWAVVEKVGFEKDAERCGYSGVPLPITAKPENISVVVAGGAAAAHGFWMQFGVSGLPATAEIKLPANWDALLKEAEKDLGPVPDA